MILRYLFITILLYAGATSALQTFNLTTDERITAKISEKNLNRIMVQNDRVTQVFGSEGEFVIETEPTSGQVFIKPSRVDISKNINLTLVTEQGKTIDLLLQPKDIMAETIVLRSSNVNKDKARIWEQSRAFEDQLAELVAAMANGSQVPGFKITYAKQPWKIWYNLQITQLGEYKGAKFTGNIYQIKNVTSELQKLHESQFMLQGNTAAIALMNRNLAPGNITTLFMVAYD